MSAQDAIDKLLSTLKSTASYYQSTTQQLIATAANALDAWNPPDGGRLRYDVDRALSDLTRLPRPPTLPAIEPLQLPVMDALQPVIDIKDQFTGTKPKLNLPDFSKPPQDPVPVFTASVPSAQSLTIAPDAPPLAEPPPPDLTVPKTISADPVQYSLPTAALPHAVAFSGNATAAYQEGMALMGGELADWRAWLDGVRGQLLPLESAWIELLTGVISGRQPGLPDAWEDARFQSAQQAAMSERLLAVDALDAQPSAVTGLPLGARRYAQLLLEWRTLQAVTQGAAQTTNARQDLEAQHRQWALGLALRAADAAITLRGQEIHYRMQGMAQALDGAQITLTVALKMLEFKRRELALFVRYNDWQIRNLHNAIKLDQTQVTALNLQVANNQLTLTHDQHQSQIYRLAQEFIGTRIRCYQAQLEMVGIDADWRELDFARFEAQVLAYQATVQGYLAEQAGRRAQLKGDVAKADGEFAKARVYQAEMQAQTAEIKAKTAAMAATTAENQGKLNAYNAEVDAQMAALRLLDQNSRTAISAIVKGFAAETSEQEITLANQQLQDQQALLDATHAMEQEQFDLLSEIQESTVQLEQAAALSAITNSGAATLGSVAAAAFSGLNAVGVRQLTENG